MGFFETFWTWLNTQLNTYVADESARIATALEPTAVTIAVLYVMVWGYLQLTGRIDEPFTTGLRRILTVGVVLGVALRMWLYNQVIVDTFYNAPAQLAAAAVGARDPVQTIDSIWQQGGTVAGYLWNNGGLFHLDFGYYLAGAVVWLFVGLLCVYTMFLIALSHVALSLLLALGPFFFVMVFFDLTRRLFDSWLALLANYAFITILTVMAAALLLQLANNYATQTAALGSAVMTVDALNMVLVAVLVFLFLRQVMPIAASLTGGGAISTLGTVSRVIAWTSRRSLAMAQAGGRAVVLAVRPGE